MQYESFGNSKLWFFYDVDGNPSGVRYNNRSSTFYYYFVCNWRGDVLKIFDSSGSLVANYDYDAWGNVVSITNANDVEITSTTHIANVNPLRYRGYYYDAETGMYWLQSRYYDPEVRRFINADSVLDNRGINTLNLFMYCGNNPVSNSDPYGHFYFGTLVGGIVGGATGALVALVKRKSVTAGFLTGSATGAAIGLVCDIVATGGMSAVVGFVLCGAAAGVGNAVNQYANYKVEKKTKTQSKNSTSILEGKNNLTSSSRKKASECDSFAEYVYVNSIAISCVTAMSFAPLSIGANFVINSAFAGVEMVGVMGFIAQFGANFVMGGNISILQSIIDLF